MGCQRVTIDHAGEDRTVKLLRPPGITLEIPRAVVTEIIAGNDNDPAKQAIQSGRAPFDTEIERSVIE